MCTDTDIEIMTKCRFSRSACQKYGNAVNLKCDFKNRNVLLSA